MELTKEMSGQLISCIINNTYIKEAEIYYSNIEKEIYILQDYQVGFKAIDNKKSKYILSWMMDNKVKNIEFLTKTHELWT